LNECGRLAGRSLKARNADGRADARMQHYFTVDVEEYFQVSALEPYVPRERWGMLESRVRGAVERLLVALDGHRARATFFFLSWIAERDRQLVGEVVRGGHEIASHGTDHTRVTRLDPAAFRESVRRSKRTLEDLSGVEVLGYRAPSYSIVPGREWALEILVEEGYRYDSSLFPIRRPDYGYPGTRREPHAIQTPAGPLHEFPPATLRIAGLNVPAAGGGYFRQMPYGLTRLALRQAEKRGIPGMFYIHPWELDPHQPRLPVPWLTRIRHYRGLGRVAERLERLLTEFRFGRVRDSL